VQGSLFGRQARITVVKADEIRIGSRVFPVATCDELSDLALGTTVIPLGNLTLVVSRIRLLLGQPLIQGLPLGLFRSGGAEQQGAPVTVARIASVVAFSVEQCVLSAVTFEDLPGVITSGHGHLGYWPHRRGRASGEHRLIVTVVVTTSAGRRRTRFNCRGMHVPFRSRSPEQPRRRGVSGSGVRAKRASELPEECVGPADQPGYVDVIGRIIGVADDPVAPPAKECRRSDFVPAQEVREADCQLGQPLP
jgi:hypothetical protein